MILIRRRITTAFAAALAVAAAGSIAPEAVSGPADDLPDIGSPSDALLPPNTARAIGRSVVRQLREAGQVLEDPEVSEYVQTLGSRLAMHAHEGDHRFTFFVVNDNGINAFALPGGYIGVNAGLIEATQTESELAGVLAHEIAHVTQKHIARRADAMGRTSILTAAAVAAAIIMGASGAGGDAVQAAAMGAQGFQAQQQINYTRVNEYEADRVGMQILYAAGFDPYGMPSFFETMNRLNGSMANRVPEFLLTHPLTSTRVAEARSRAEKLPPMDQVDSINYPLMRARLRILTARSPAEGAEHFQGMIDRNVDAEEPYVRYGLGLGLMQSGKAASAERIFFDLRDHNEGVVAYHSALGQAQLIAGQPAEGLITFEQAQALFPRNRPLTVRHAEALIRVGRFEDAHMLLLDLFNNVPPTPPEVKLIATAADSAGQRAEALYYMAEYHLLVGQLPQAVDKLRLALGQPDIQDVQRARFQARLDELMPYLADAKKAQRGGR
jgi:predicted Zn-dependent protease